MRDLGEVKRAGWASQTGGGEWALGRLIGGVKGVGHVMRASAVQQAS